MDSNVNIDDLGFTDKVVLFSSASDTVAVKNITFKLQNGKLFATGYVPKGETNNDWAVDRPCAVEWNSVEDYIVFDSEEQYAELLAKG